MTPPGESESVVALVRQEDASWLGRWRTRTGLEVCVHEAHLWVRGPAQPDGRFLPAVARFTADAEGRLTPPGGRVPRARWPQGPWQPLAEFLRIQPPSSHLPGHPVAPIPWSLVPSAQFRPPGLLIVPFETLALWGLAAPAVRLAPLRFAVSHDRRACVTGNPLPPLAGAGWWMEGGLALPAGWGFPRGLTAALAAKSLSLGASEIALLHPDGTAERFDDACFVPVTRSALRATRAPFLAGLENPEPS